MNKENTTPTNAAPALAELMDILGQGVTAAEEAVQAAQAGRHSEARELLAIADEQLTAGAGGSAAHAQRRRKLIRLTEEAKALLPAPATELVSELPTPAPAAPEGDDVAPAAPEAPAAEAPAPAAPARAPGAHRPQPVTDAQWQKVAEALLIEEVNPDWSEANAERHWQAMDRAEIEHPGTRFWMRVEQARALHAELEVAVLRGDFNAANERWGQIFDVDTNIRSKAQAERRKGLEGAEGKMAAYEEARARTARVKGWLKAGKRAA